MIIYKGGFLNNKKLFILGYNLALNHNEAVEI